MTLADLVARLVATADHIGVTDFAVDGPTVDDLRAALAAAKREVVVKVGTVDDVDLDPDTGYSSVQYNFPDPNVYDGTVFCGVDLTQFKDQRVEVVIRPAVDSRSNA